MTRELIDTIAEIMNNAKGYELFEVTETHEGNTNRFYASGLKRTASTRCPCIVFTKQFADSYLTKAIIETAAMNDNGRYTFGGGDYCYSVKATRKKRHTETAAELFTEDMFFNPKYADKEKVKASETTVFIPFDFGNVTYTSLAKAREASYFVSKLLHGLREETQTPRSTAFTVCFNEDSGDEVTVWGHLYSLFDEERLTDVVVYKGEKKRLGI